MELDGRTWRRGRLIGKGGFGSVYLATIKKPNGYLPSLLAVKTAEISHSASLQREGEVLKTLTGCPNVIGCFGDEFTVSDDHSRMAYNLLLEYAAGGTLTRLIENSVDGLPELDVKRYTKSIVRGIHHVHGCGYVHCDLKPENLLLVPIADSESKFIVKIGDFGLAKRMGSRKKKLDPYLRGSAMYLAPECVIHHEQEPPSDIWSLGCIVLEMLTGKMPWGLKPGFRSKDVLQLLQDTPKFPAIPTGISKEATQFLKSCFVRNPELRFTVEMLMDHPFLAGVDDGYMEIKSTSEIQTQFQSDEESESSSDDDSDSDLYSWSSQEYDDESCRSDEDSSISGRSTKRRRVSEFIVKESLDGLLDGKPTAPLKIVDQTPTPTVRAGV